MKRSRLISCLGALTLAFFLPVVASAGTHSGTASKAGAANAKSITATNATAAKSSTHAKGITATNAGAAKSSTGAKKAKTHKMDLNSASREELMTLPGVDGAAADKIIENRPYKSMNELVSKNVVSKSEYTKIRRKVTARQSAMHSEAPGKEMPGMNSAATGAPAGDKGGTGQDPGTTDNTTK